MSWSSGRWMSITYILFFNGSIMCPVEFTVLYSLHYLFQNKRNFLQKSFIYFWRNFLQVPFNSWAQNSFLVCSMTLMNTFYFSRCFNCFEMSSERFKCFTYMCGFCLWERYHFLLCLLINNSINRWLFLRS